MNKLSVVNDSAERRVKLIKDYNILLTTNELEKQYIMQIVNQTENVFRLHKGHFIKATNFLAYTCNTRIFWKC